MKIAGAILSAALAFGGMSSPAHAASYNIDFDIDSTRGNVVSQSGTPYGVTPPFHVTGTATVTAGDTSGNSFTAFDLQFGSKDFGLSDIDTATSSVSFNGDGSFQQFFINFLEPGNWFGTNNTLAVQDSGGEFSCNDCVAMNVAATPVPATLPLVVSGLGALGFASWRRRKSAA
jgi:hypothetical protein